MPLPSAYLRPERLLLGVVQQREVVRAGAGGGDAVPLAGGEVLELVAKPATYAARAHATSSWARREPISMQGR